MHRDKLIGFPVPHSTQTRLSARWMLAIGWFWGGIGASHIRQVGVLNGTKELQCTQVPI